MTKQHWIELAEQYKVGAEEEIEEDEQVSSREAFWPAVKRRIAYNREFVKFLETGIVLMKGESDGR